MNTLFDKQTDPDTRTDAQREAHREQIPFELRQCEDGVTYLRLAEITPHWREELVELERRGERFEYAEIEPRYGNVRVK